MEWLKLGGVLMVVKDMYVCFVTMGRFSFLSDGRWRELVLKSLMEGGRVPSS
jgi:hypothetical protein